MGSEGRLFFVSRLSEGRYVYINSWFATTWQGGHVGGQRTGMFSRRIEMKIEFSSQRRGMLLFLSTNIAAMTSRANQQYGSSHLNVGIVKNGKIECDRKVGRRWRMELSKLYLFNKKNKLFIFLRAFMLTKFSVLFSVRCKYRCCTILFQWLV